MFSGILSLLLVLLMGNPGSPIQEQMPSEWKIYTREDCFYSVSHEINRKNLSESEFREYLLNEARAEVARQIKIIVHDVSSLETNAVNGKGEVIYRASSNFSTDVTLRYLKTRSVYDTKKREGYAIAWISRSDLQDIYKSRAAKVAAMLDVSVRAEEEGKVDIALKYAYWALILQYTLPEDFVVRYPEGGLAVSLYARDRIESLLSGLSFRYLGPSPSDPLTGRLEATYQGRPVTSLDFTYDDGMGTSDAMQVRDGVGLIEFRAGMEVRNIDVKVEYTYRDESASDPEMKMALAEVSPIYFPDALKRGVSVYAKASSVGVPSVSASLSKTVEAAFGQISAGVSSVMPERNLQAVCAGRVADVVAAIGRKDYSSVRSLFTDEGYEVFERLLHYGKARVLDDSPVQVVAEAGGYVCRSVPMKFSFPNNSKSFWENIVFRMDAAGKINNLTFALDAEAVQGILSKTQWPDGAKMALIDFLENYKTAFALTRLDYISSIFSDDALIVVGRTVKTTRLDNGIRMTQDAVLYNRYTKSAYIEQLSRSFASKEYINLRFANADVCKLTRGVHKNLYGIQLKQDYFSSNYGDTGYLYLLVDMEDSERPLIYIRTWQPQPDPDFGLYGPGSDFNFSE